MELPLTIISVQLKRPPTSTAPPGFRGYLRINVGLGFQSITFYRMGKSNGKSPRSIELNTQSEEVAERKPNPSLILLSSDDDAYDNPSLKTVEKSNLKASVNVNSNVNPSICSDSEVTITDVKTNTKKTKEMIAAQSNVEDTKKKEESIELKETEGILESDPVEKSDNVVLKKLLRGPRYFDPQENNWGNCYNCGEAGHTIASCTMPKKKKPCFVCGSFEHNAKQCKQGKDCFMCKKSGHRAKDCPEKSIKGSQKAKLCLKCGDSGHEMFTCKNSYSLDDLKEIQCYICQCFGHICCVNYGKGASDVSCYRCGQVGHTGLGCVVNSHAHVKTSNTKSPTSSCYKCGVDGHKARKCPTSNKKRKRKTKLPKQLQDNQPHIGVKSAPHDVREGHKRHKTQNVHSTPYQPKHRGQWINEDLGRYHHDNRWGSPSTPPPYQPSTYQQSTYQPNNSFHRNYGTNDYRYGNGLSFPYEASSPNGYHHGISRLRFGDSGNHGANDYSYGNGLSFPYEASGSNGHHHGFPRSRFGDSGNYGRRDPNWEY